MEPTNPNTAETNLEQRMRTVRTLWLAITVSVVMYYVFTRVAERPESLQPNQPLSLALLVGAVSTTLVSFLIKDIALLGAHFAPKYGERVGRPITKIDGRTLAALSAYHWPGQVEL